jgi:LysR family transcriptional regulator, glycine cleavage system transcriptional activator
MELLRTFESASRHLSFTLAAGELFLTQSAVSRQIQQLEAAVGAPLFERQHRALALTEAGMVMRRAVVDALERLRDATARIRATASLRQVSLTCTPGFASLWLIPRLSRFTRTHPQVDVRFSATLDLLDLERNQVDVAIRFCPIADGVGPPLFEETLTPVCSPALARDKSNPLRKPADLANHTLLTVNMPHGQSLTADWEPWTQIIGLPELRMKNAVYFSSYADTVAAAVAGQGVAIGRLPLLAELIADKRLVAPLQDGGASQRGYYVMVSPAGEGNADAQDFVKWLRAEAEAAQGLGSGV